MVRNGRTYLYENRSYRDQGKVKQESRYLGIETEINGQKITKAPENRTPVRKILMLAAECITGSDHSIHLHTGIPDLKEKGDPRSDRSGGRQ